MWQRGGVSEEKTDYMGSERGFTMTYCSLSVQTNTISEVIKSERGGGVYSQHLVTNWNTKYGNYIHKEMCCLDILAI